MAKRESFGFVINASEVFSIKITTHVSSFLRQKVTYFMPAFVLLILVLSIALLSHSFYSCLHVIGKALFEEGSRGNLLSQIKRPGS